MRTASSEGCVCVLTSQKSGSGVHLFVVYPTFWDCEWWGFGFLSGIISYTLRFSPLCPWQCALMKLYLYLDASTVHLLFQSSNLATSKIFVIRHTSLSVTFKPNVCIYKSYVLLTTHVLSIRILSFMGFWNSIKLTWYFFFPHSSGSSCKLCGMFGDLALPIVLNRTPKVTFSCFYLLWALVSFH